MEKNKELTPMMELINQLDVILRLIDEPTSELDFKYCISVLKEKATELLTKEKQVIINARDDIYVTGDLSAEEYYNTKYNNQIK